LPGAAPRLPLEGGCSSPTGPDDASREPRSAAAVALSSGRCYR